MEREIEEKLRKLAPLGTRKADLGWLFYLSGEAEERQSADELIDILLFQENFLLHEFFVHLHLMYSKDILPFF